MDAIILILVLCLLFHPSIINGQVVKLSFNTAMYESRPRIYYYAHIGKDVTLTCTVLSWATRQVYMYKGMSVWDYKILVDDGELVRDVTNDNSKYSFVPFNRTYQLTIHNLEIADSLNYFCLVCPSGWLWSNCKWRKAYLEVKETTGGSKNPGFCDLDSTTGGIFFTGNNLILRCPAKLGFTFTASDGSTKFKVEFDDEEEGPVFNRFEIQNLTEKYNGTMLSCFNFEQNNYCRNLPRITVFNELTIKLSHEKHGITNLENVNFTCYSYPFLPFTIEWDMQQGDVIFGNVSVSEISQGSRIAINNVEFPNSTSSSLTVSCNVTIGSENKFKMATVYFEVQSNPVAIVVPITLVIITFGIVILVLVYIKARKRVTSKEVDTQNANINQGVGNAEENVYHTRNNEKTELGLTNHDSEVVDNVAYVSYNEVLKAQ